MDSVGLLKGMRKTGYKNAPWMQEEGLQTPPEVQMLIQSLLMSPAMGAVGGSLRGMGQAGAIFPKGAPGDLEGAVKAPNELLTDAERSFKGWAASALSHARNYDWPNVLADKWGLLKHMGGN